MGANSARWRSGWILNISVKEELFNLILNKELLIWIMQITLIK